MWLPQSTIYLALLIWLTNSRPTYGIVEISTEEATTALNTESTTNKSTTTLRFDLMATTRTSIVPATPTPTPTPARNSMTTSGTQISTTNAVSPVPTSGTISTSTSETSTEIATTSKTLILSSLSVAKRQFKPCGLHNDAHCVPYEQCNEGITILGKFYVDHTRTMLDEPCHYMEKCCSIVATLPVTRVTQQPHKDVASASAYRTCGERLDDWIYLRPLGYKQKEAKFAEFPWIVGIFTQSGVYACSGALITAEIAITAAHCVQPVGGPLIVRAGEWDALVELEPLPHQHQRVKEVIIHSNYTKMPVMHNLALLWLEAPFRLAPHIQTICLPAPTTNFNYSQCFVIGWDKAQFGNTSYKEIMLKKVPMFALPSDQCAAKIRLAILGRRYTLHDSFICTGGDKDEFICRDGGAGGGGVPLVCTINGHERFFLAGLLARGARCDGKQLLGIYTNIKYYRAWIDLKLRERDVDIRYYLV